VAVTVTPVASAADRRAFVELPFRLYRDDPSWVPPLKAEVHGLINPRENPWFEHGEAQYFLSVRDRSGALRQFGVTALGSDSTRKLYAGFTSVPVERRWITAAIRSLRGG